VAAEATAGNGGGPRVGVLIPVHGFAPYLAEALDCVLEQDPAPDAVVVIDDGSPDPVVLHPDHARAVMMVRRETCGGPAAARAAGLNALDPEIDLVALCDADDAWEPGKLSAQLREMQATPGAGWCFGRAHVVGPDGRPTGERWHEPAPGRHPARALGAALYEQNPVPTSSVVLRRAVLESGGGFESEVGVAEDWELWLRLAGIGADALCVPDAVVRYRRHPGGLTADVTRLAAAQLAVHSVHGRLVDERTRRRVEGADLAALAAGCAREGRYADARWALREASRRRPAGAHERAARLLLAVPVARRAVGRRDPYRR
jgi:glycosyltransferase involved in cell wall biosynthesis